MAVVNVIYWNVQRSKAAMIEAVDGRREYDVMAIQEQWQNPHLPTTYCPRNSRYHLVYAGAGSRSAILVHKRHRIADWESTATPDWCQVRLRTGGDEVTIYSIYSPIPNQTLTQWRSPIHHLATLEPQLRALLVACRRL